jgi:glutamate/tyrosine decarboxylase-like PLP-dependent enzyme
LFSGVERADSLIVDPHKWLFGPFDSCALLYREPALAKQAHQQRAPYLEVLNGTEDGPVSGWNPSDYALHLSRRPRGLPTWFSLVALGTDAYSEAIDSTMALAEDAAELIGSSAHLQLLVEPELSTVVFRRRGWTREQHENWSRKTLASGMAVVMPTVWNGEVALRICIVNPRTTIGDMEAVVDSLR